MKKLIAFILGTNRNTEPTPQASEILKTLANQKNEILAMFERAQENGEATQLTDIAQQLNDTHRAIADINRQRGKFSNLY